MKTTIPESIQQLVSAWLLAKAYAEVMREAVDKITIEVLAECPLAVSDEWKKEGRRELPFDLITDPKYVYLTDLDSPEYTEHKNEVRYREEGAGLRVNMPSDDHCPALMAEDAVRKIEHRIIEVMAETLTPGVTLHKLLCSGVDKYREFIDLTVKMVLAYPGYVAPKVA